MKGGGEGEKKGAGQCRLTPPPPPQRRKARPGGPDAWTQSQACMGGVREDNKVVDFTHNLQNSTTRSAMPRTCVCAAWCQQACQQRTIWRPAPAAAALHGAVRICTPLYASARTPWASRQPRAGL